MATIVFNKKEFLEKIAEFIDDDEYVIFSTDVCGTVSAPSKKVPAKLIPFAFSKGAFASKDSISDLMRTKLGGMVIMKLEQIDESMRKEIENEQRNNTQKPG